MKRILDIGCGDRPMKRANFFVDRFPSDSKHRSGREIKKFPKNFVAADAGNLPFKDNSFDYCYCHHAIEHMKHPEEALREMGRVSLMGRIQAPHWFYELVRRRDNHYWLVLKRKGILILIQKTKRERDNKPLFHLFQFSILGIEKALRVLDLWETDWEWRGWPYFSVIYEDGVIEG